MPRGGQRAVLIRLAHFQLIQCRKRIFVSGENGIIVFDKLLFSIMFSSVVCDGSLSLSQGYYACGTLRLPAGISEITNYLWSWENHKIWNITMLPCETPSQCFKIFCRQMLLVLFFSKNTITNKIFFTLFCIIFSFKRRKVLDNDYRFIPC